jgi:integrase
MARLWKSTGRTVWQALIRLPDGRRIWRTTGCTDRRAAELRARQFERELAEAGDAKDEAHPLGESLKFFIDDRRRIGRAYGTVKMYDIKAGHLVRIIGGDRDIAGLTLDDVSHYIDKRKVEGACTNTISKELVTLRAALRVARKRKIYAGDPKDLIPTDFAPKYIPRKRWLTTEEFEKLIAVLPAKRRPHVAIIVYTGLRLSEAARLRPEHVDLQKRRLSVPGTKTEEASATIPLSSSALPWFQAALAQRPEDQETLLAPWGNIRRDLRAACDELKIAPVSANDLRRTFSSWLEQAGVPRSTNARLMRHTTTAMVDKVYAQSAPDQLTAAVDNLPKTHVTPVPTDIAADTGKRPVAGSHGSAS